MSYLRSLCQRRPDRLWDCLALIVFLVLPLPLLGGTVLGGESLAPAGQLGHFAAWPANSQPPAWDVLYWDDLAQLLPWQAAARESVRAGRAPLWDPYPACGAPLLANSQVSGLSPFWLALSHVNLPRVQGLLALFQLWLAGAGTYLFLRRHGLSCLPCGLGAAAYQLSGWSLCWAEFPNRHAPVAWLPVCLWLLASALERGGGWIAACALALAVSVLSSHLQFEFYVFLAVALYGIGCLALRRRANCRASIGPWAAAGTLMAILTLAALLAAPQLIPSLELGHWSARFAQRSWSDYTSRVGGFAMPIWWLAQVFVPGFFGFPSHGDVPMGMDMPPVPFFSADFYEFCVVVGSVPLLLAIHGIRQVRQSFLPAFLSLLGAISLLLAMGSLLNAPLYFGLPGFSGMAGTARMLYLFAFAVAGLAAVGAQAALDYGLRPSTAPGRPRPGKAASIWQGVGVPLADLAEAALLGAFFCGLAAWLLAASARTPLDAWEILAYRSGDMALPAALLVLATGGVMVMRLWPARARAALVGLAALCAAQLLALGASVVQTTPAGSVFPVSPAIQAIRALRPFRLASVGRNWTLGWPMGPAPEQIASRLPVLPPNTAAWYGLSTLESYDSLNTRAYTEYLRRLDGRNPFPPENGNMALVTGADSPLLGKAGVDMVVSPTPLQSSTLVREQAPDGLFLYRVRGCRPPASVQSPGGQVTPARVIRWQAGLIDVAGAVGPGRLIVLDADVPGWAVQVDGQPARLTEADGLFKAVSLAAGTHRVTFEYRPLSFRLGVFLSALGLALIMAAGAARPVASRALDTGSADELVPGQERREGQTLA